jgi:hypothetical protein
MDEKSVFIFVPTNRKNMKTISISELKKSNKIYLFIYEKGSKVILEKNLTFEQAREKQVEYNRKGVYIYYAI